MIYLNNSFIIQEGVWKLVGKTTFYETFIYTKKGEERWSARRTWHCLGSSVIVYIIFLQRQNLQVPWVEYTHGTFHIAKVITEHGETWKPVKRSAETLFIIRLYN